MKVIDLFEARRNPDQNPKVRALQQLIQLRDQHPNELLFVRYVDDPKLGIYAKTHYDTPLGICAYPIEFVIDCKMNVPFGSYRRYVVVFSVTDQPGILRVDNVDVSKFKPNMERALISVLGLSTLPKIADYIKPLDDINKCWDYMRFVIGQRCTNKRGLMFRKVLIAMGYNIGIIDPGLGVIHTNEPAQAIFFDIRKLNLLSTIYRSDEIRADQKRYDRNRWKKLEMSLNEPLSGDTTGYKL